MSIIQPVHSQSATTGNSRQLPSVSGTYWFALTVLAEAKARPGQMHSFAGKEMTIYTNGGGAGPWPGPHLPFCLHFLFVCFFHYI